MGVGGGKPGLLFTFCVTKNLGETPCLIPGWVTARAAWSPTPPHPAPHPATKLFCFPHPSPQQPGRLGIGERIKLGFERKFI